VIPALLTILALNFAFQCSTNNFSFKFCFSSRYFFIMFQITINSNFCGFFCWSLWILKMFEEFFHFENPYIYIPFLKFSGHNSWQKKIGPNRLNIVRGELEGGPGTRPPLSSWRGGPFNIFTSKLKFKKVYLQCTIAMSNFIELV